MSTEQDVDATAAAGSVFPLALRGCFGGSGSALMGTPEAVEAIIELSGKPKPSVLYLGTATYDFAGPCKKQTSGFTAAGCTVTSLDVARSSLSREEITRAILAADVILVSGGNTLFAIDRWCSLGVSDALKEAMLCGKVLAGGSAGAICWFDGGHSDSMDPGSYLATPFDFTGNPDDDPGERAQWEYIRVPCLGFLPGLVCPHQDRIQTNGVLRADDFDQMLLRHAGEHGICIDHYAALVVEGERYRVLSLPDKEGSVMEDGSSSRTQAGKPGIWLKSVVDGRVEETLVPSSGCLSDILRPAVEIVEDSRLEVARRANPQPEA